MWDLEYGYNMEKKETSLEKESRIFWTFYGLLILILFIIYSISMIYHEFIILPKRENERLIIDNQICHINLIRQDGKKMKLTVKRKNYYFYKNVNIICINNKNYQYIESSINCED